jgi:hypothetical protein
LLPRASIPAKYARTDSSGFSDRTWGCRAAVAEVLNRTAEMNAPIDKIYNPQKKKDKIYNSQKKKTKSTTQTKLCVSSVGIVSSVCILTITLAISAHLWSCCSKTMQDPLKFVLAAGIGTLLLVSLVVLRIYLVSSSTKRKGSILLVVSSAKAAAGSRECACAFHSDNNRLKLLMKFLLPLRAGMELCWW